MSITGLPEPYCTVAYADIINAGQAEWDAADTATKEAALQYGRMYIDTKYVCSVLDEDSPAENIQTSNAALGQYHLVSPLFDPAQAATDQENKGLESKSSGAGSVFSKKSYNAGIANQKVDPYPDVTAIMTHDGVCRYKTGTVTPLMRR